MAETPAAFAFRCSCGRRLVDVEDSVERGGVRLTIKCPKCGAVNNLVLTK